MNKRASSFAYFFKRLNTKGGDGGRARRWKLRTSAGFRWKGRINLRYWVVDVFVFKIISVLEAVVLLAKLCFFFLCFAFLWKDGVNCVDFEWVSE
ncbi:Unknown protein [Striga hermonthica]|uniref:Transmembrane protein n=1 Tax=Striga hermonthica TaxID=68872 RepID=A0A9N7NLY4_STRHE|nr:Unknown protein [Striga hermonthica]